ncbi:hypothetical protein, partial [Bilophila wadsworthia]|uniref:hypothetical protein n=1 Tax=Bilophila wadsworthia TaxID=35833 RepID=UPI003AB643A0
PNAGVVAMDVQSDTRLAQKISVTVAGQSYGGSHAFDSEASPYRMSFVGFGCRGWRDALADWEVGLLGHCEAWILGRNFLSVFHEKGRVGWIGKPHEGDFSFEIFPHFYYISL